SDDDTVACAVEKPRSTDSSSTTAFGANPHYLKAGEKQTTSARSTSCSPQSIDAEQGKRREVHDDRVASMIRSTQIARLDGTPFSSPLHARQSVQRTMELIANPLLFHRPHALRVSRRRRDRACALGGEGPSQADPAAAGA